MRESLRQLVQSSVLFKYNLPNDPLKLSRFKTSNADDFCYSSSNNEELSRIIYNSLIEYAFDQYQISEYDFGTLHRRALTRKLKFNIDASEATQLRYGFYGEVMLYCMLHIFHGAAPLIARGHFYNPLENSETKGYDSYHLIETSSEYELWFGEVKFYADFVSATTGENGAITKPRETYKR